MAKKSMEALRAAGQVIQAKRRVKSACQLIQDAKLSPKPSQIPLIETRVAEMPSTFRQTYLKALKGKSMTAGIKAFCAECVCWERDEVRKCTAPACPLFPYRPFV